MAALTTTSPTAIRSLYRRLLRELPSRAHQPGQSLLSNPSALQLRIRSSFTDDATTHNAVYGEGNVKETVSRLEEAEQIALYARSQRVYTTLVERYNPGVNMVEEDRVRLTARRVGLDLPVQATRGKVGDSE